MPIPGDNGNPKKERDQQNARIEEVGKTGGDVKCEVKLGKPAPKEKTIFGKI
jgi:hypothetical protein